FGGDILDSNDNIIFNVTDKGYYYFRNGTDLRNITTDLTNNNLIKIDDTDPIVKDLDSLIGITLGGSSPLWNEE
ncbi:MAG: hypothetical protein K8R73_04100, partial [Clostridiales bacterium]|nr:hypothetical protein [Clostridiales bacterium]